jgi:hypothetical protein
VAGLVHAAVAELEHLREVVAGVHVQDRERQRRRPKRLLGHAQERDRVLAAAEQEDGPLELDHDLAQHVDRLGLERPEVRDAAPRRRGGGRAHARTASRSVR